MIIFTDGSWENGAGGIGAVVVDQATDTRRVLSGEVPCELAELWSESVGLQAICEVELLAVVALREILGESLRDRRVIFWVDNESARFGLIKGISKSLPMQNLLHQFCELELGIPCFQWYAISLQLCGWALSPELHGGVCVAGLAGAGTL